MKAFYRQLAFSALTTAMPCILKAISNKFYILNNDLHHIHVRIIFSVEPASCKMLLFFDRPNLLYHRTHPIGHPPFSPARHCSSEPTSLLIPLPRLYFLANKAPAASFPLQFKIVDSFAFSSVFFSLISTPLCNWMNESRNLFLHWKSTQPATTRKAYGKSSR